MIKGFFTRQNETTWMGLANEVLDSGRGFVTGFEKRKLLDIPYYPTCLANLPTLGVELSLPDRHGRREI